ncbi:MAG: M18 family aminopeptidase [Clostridia bacterium]|nr:M18 family aminopeptidase [Clostridia bacterium]
MDLKEYLKRSVSPFHTVSTCKERLLEEGFRELKIGRRDADHSDGSFVIEPYPSVLFAVRYCEEGKDKAHIGTAHTDFPNFKLKPNCEFDSQGYAMINTEPYGGLLKRTWFDRPLGIAGKVIIKGEDEYEPKEILYRSEEPYLIIPGLAPHMDREIENKPIDVQQEMCPVYSMEEGASILERIALYLGIKKEDILDYDLYLFNNDEPQYIGLKGEFISSPRIDNVSSCAALTEGLIESSVSDAKINLICLFDNEEIGSRSKQGADSELMLMVLRYLHDIFGIEKDLDAFLLDSFMVSVDGAHALHPSYRNKADTTSVVYLGKGFVLKNSATQRYVTDAKASAIVKAICEKNDIPVQQQANRSGAPGGQTLGPIASSYVPAMACDIGVPLLSMHSARELAHRDDYDSLKAFLSSIL